MPLLWYHRGALRILVDYRPALRNRTGVGEYAHEMAAALARQSGTNDQITLFSSSWKDRLPPGVVPGARAVDRRIPVSLLNLAWHRLGWPVVERLAGEADVAWSMHPLLMPTARAARVVTIHDLFFLDRPDATVREIRRDYAPLVAAHARRADGVIVVSEYTGRAVVDRLGVHADRVTVCPNGAPRWPPREEPLMPGPILHVGTIEPRKNVPALLQAYAELVRHNRDSPPLVFAGRAESPAKVSIPPTVHERVRFLGYVADDQRLRHYREASLVVIASEDEGFGLPALEAMTLGVPVVATARGAIPEVVGDAGVLVNERDPAKLPVALAAAMQRVLSDRVLRDDLRRRGIARSRLFDWDQSASRAREALAAAIRRRRDRGGCR